MSSASPHIDSDSTTPEKKRDGDAWRKNGLKQYRAIQTPESRSDEQERLQRVFDLASQSPALKEALDWAEAHDIDIIVDYTARNIGGYYTTGTGVVALAQSAFMSDRRLAGVVAHEIRHAWQDYHGLIATAEYRLDHYIIKNALIEADATAHQNLAELQVHVQNQAEFFKDLAEMGTDITVAAKRNEAEAQRMADPEAFLLESFRGWYASQNPGIYGRAAAQRFAQQHAMTDAKPPDWNLSLPIDDISAEMGVNFLSRPALRALGNGYNGGNYFKSADMKQVKAEQLSAASARRFFNRAAANDIALVKEVVKREAAERKATGTRRLVNPWAP